MYKVGV